MPRHAHLTCPARRPPGAPRAWQVLFVALCASGLAADAHAGADDDDDELVIIDDVDLVDASKGDDAIVIDDDDETIIIL